MTLSMPVDDHVMDFSSPRKSLRFKVDDDIFEAAPDIAAELALEFADFAERAQESNDVQDNIAVIRAMFNMVLFPDSAERFIARLRDTKHPIGTARMTNIIKWLYEEYGLRPTESDSASARGPENPDAGTSLTVSSSAVA
jgi:hypothetical protein